MDFLSWCQGSDRWWTHSWANDPKCRLAEGAEESPAAYAQTFTAAGYGAYLDRLENDSAWGEYLSATKGRS